jgi:MOSC domain-containing protein YiiM
LGSLKKLAQNTMQAGGIQTSISQGNRNLGGSMSLSPTLVSIQVGVPTSYGDAAATNPMDQPWTTSFFKQPVHGPVAVLATSLVGDGQADLENHGGADKAILAYSADHYPFWKQELGLNEMPWGEFGENLSITGLDESSVCIGDTWRLGATLLQVTQPRQPCWKLARRWRIKDLAARVVENGKCGWYLRVLEQGTIEAGQTLQLVERPRPEWTVARAHVLMHHQKRDWEQSLELAALPELSQAWRSSLQGRAERARK